MIDYILDLIYPPVCGICKKISKENLCNECTLKLDKYKINVNTKLKEDNMYFDEAFHIFKYEGIIRDAIISYKFQNKAYLYKTFSKIILKNGKAYSFLKKYDIIIPVPIHKKRKQKRGYNQTELIAKEIAKNTHLELQKNVLIKSLNIVPQSELNRKERKENIKNVFELKNFDKIRNKNIIIFDDIYTTGSTLNECAKILRNAECKNIGILTIAKD